MALSWTARFIYSQFFVTLPKPDFDLTGQTVIVTGSNTGLGLEAARHIAQLGASHIIIAVRTTSKGEKAIENILASCNNHGQTLEVWELDMSSITSIKKFAARASKADRLDAAILNAGVLSEKWTEYEGIESTMAVNVIGTILLSYLLLPIMSASAKRTGQRGRLAIVGSEMMYLANRKTLQTSASIVNRLKDASYISELADRYPQSKLLVFYAMHKLATDHPLSTSNVLVDILTPGACHSDIFREGKSFVMNIMLASVARSTEAGSRTLVHGIDTRLPDDAHGSFLFNCAIDANAASTLKGNENQKLYNKWTAEMSAYLEKVAPGSTKG